MSAKKLISWIVAGLGFVLIVIFLFRLDQSFSEIQDSKIIPVAIKNYHLSIWCGWILITFSAIYASWKKNTHLLFIIDYLIMITAFILLGYYMDKAVTYNLWTVGTSLQQGVFFMVIKNIILICVMTGFIQASLWWFSKRWHRH